MCNHHLSIYFHNKDPHNSILLLTLMLTLMFVHLVLVRLVKALMLALMLTLIQKLDYFQTLLYLFTPYFNY